MAEKIRFTDRSVEKIPVPDIGSTWVRDEAIPGFRVRVWPSGARVYVFRCGAGKGKRGQHRPITIGHHGAPWTPDPETGKPRNLTADLARREAERLRGLARTGGDPGGLRAERAGVATLADFQKTYFSHKEKKRKASTIKGDRPNYKLLAKTFKNRRLDRITTEDVERFHGSMSATPVRANRCLALLSHVFTIAVRLRELPKDFVNPCRGVEQYPESHRERRVTVKELGAAGKAMREHEDAGVVSAEGAGAIRVVIFTGARPGEIAGLKHAEIDYEREQAVKVDWKTKGKSKKMVRRVITLNAPAIAVLAAQPKRAGNPYVFPGRIRGRHISVAYLDHSWEEIRKKATAESNGKLSLLDIRLSDFGRHNFASVGMDQELPLGELAVLLGHAAGSPVTARYAHLGPSKAKRSSEAIAAEIDAALNAPVGEE